MGTIMKKHPQTYNYHHNADIIKHFMTNITDYDQNPKQFKTEPNYEDIISSNTLPYELKNKVAKIMFRQIFRALAYIHSLNICHKDIKPENVVFSSQDNEIKIIDFSIGKILSDGEDKLIDEPGGSIHFQAPELFESFAPKYNPFKNDIWSVGITLYIFISESFPFDADSELELQIIISEQEISYPEYLTS